MDISEVIYEIFKRRSGNFFAEAEEKFCKKGCLKHKDCFNNSNCEVTFNKQFYTYFKAEKSEFEPCDFAACKKTNISESYKDDDCPYSKISAGKDENGKTLERKNPMRFVQCYLNRHQFIKFLKDTDFIAAASLFRIQNVADSEIKYKQDFWYPFYTGEAYVQLPTFAPEDIIHINENEKFPEKLRWLVTAQRNKVLQSENENKKFDIFTKVETTVFPKDQELRYIDVCDGYATFMMLYFIISRRIDALEFEENKDETFYGPINWFYYEGNNSFLDDIAAFYKSKIDNVAIIDILKLKLVKEKWYRNSTWEEDLQLLGLIDSKKKKTKRFDFFLKWFEKPIDSSDEKIRDFKTILKDCIVTAEECQEYAIMLKDEANCCEKIEYEDAKKEFTLYPPLHIIVRAFQGQPIRWFFLPFGVGIAKNEQKEEKFINTSGMILLLKDDLKSEAYNPEIKHEKNEILKKVKNLLPVLNSVYSIEEQSLEDHLNAERIKSENEKNNRARLATIARIMNRNSAHHILSHIEQHTTFDAICERLNWDPIYVCNIPDNSKPNAYALYSLNKMRATYRNYVNQRYEFIAQDLTNVGTVNTYFYRDIIQPLLENTLFMDNIARDEGIMYTIKNQNTKDNCSKDNHTKIACIEPNSYNFKNKLKIQVNIFGNELWREWKESEVKKLDSRDIPYYRHITPDDKNEDIAKWDYYCNESNNETKGGEDILVSVPGSYGAHCWYSILENYIRNTVKHGKIERNSKLTIRIDIKEVDSKKCNSDKNNNYDSTEEDKNYYQVELYCDLPTLTNTKFKEIKDKVDKEYDLLDFDNIAKGIADIRINALFLGGYDLNKENLGKCLQVEKIPETNDNDSYILKYCFKIRKAMVAAEIKTNDDSLLQKNPKQGFYVFNSVDEYKKKIDNKQTPFRFLIYSGKENKVNELALLHKPLFLIDKDNCNGSNDKIGSLDKLWETYNACQKINPEDFLICSNHMEKEKWKLLSRNSPNDNPCETNNGKSVILFERHNKTFNWENIKFVEKVGKENYDFDLLWHEARDNKIDFALQSELIHYAITRILVIDERIAQRTIGSVSDISNRHRCKDEKDVKNFHLLALQSKVDIVTHIGDKALHSDIKEVMGGIKIENDSSKFRIAMCNTEEKLPYDIMIIHRKLIPDLISLLKCNQDCTNQNEHLVTILKNTAKHIYITTGSGSISDLDDAIKNEFKYIPFGVIDKYLKKSVMKINLMRNL